MKTPDTAFELLDEWQAARRLHVSKKALERWRLRGDGPPWLRIGKRLVRYDAAALRKWVEEQAAEVARG